MNRERNCRAARNGYWSRGVGDLRCVDIQNLERLVWCSFQVYDNWTACCWRERKGSGFLGDRIRWRETANERVRSARRNRERSAQVR